MIGLRSMAALSAAVAIAVGAFGAHGAGGAAAEWLKTGGQYQLVHAVAVLAVLTPGDTLPAGRRRAAWLLLVGSLVFALSLYAMAFGGPRWLGAITPFGGLGMIAGWLWLAIGWRREP